MIAYYWYWFLTKLPWVRRRTYLQNLGDLRTLWDCAARALDAIEKYPDSPEIARGHLYKGLYGLSSDE